MRKTIIALALAAAALLPVASKAQFRYGPMVGISVSDLKFKQNLISVDKTIGYSGGIVAEMMFPGIGFGIDLGLYYERRGAKLNLGEKKVWAVQNYGTENLGLHYVALPLHLRFKYTRLNGLEDIIAPLVYAGPTFGIHVGNSKLPAFDFSGGDLAIEVGAGAELFKNWQLTCSYNMGMTYVTKAKILTNYSARAHEWNIRVAYLF
ncbi:PorT family protein [Muribaculaceae bacterium Isolate-104 (HZI)]|jgi:hypothetical protein|nr:PorT family protein [Muribaculaceae bacterium Isolate-104 (HZI)]